MPHLLVVEPACVLCRHDAVAEKQMRAMRLRKALDGHFSRTGPRTRRSWIVRQRLQNGQCTELQRIELQRVNPWRHSTISRCEGYVSRVARFQGNVEVPGNGKQLGPEAALVSAVGADEFGVRTEPSSLFAFRDFEAALHSRARETAVEPCRYMFKLVERHEFARIVVADQIPHPA